MNAQRQICRPKDAICAPVARLVWIGARSVKSVDCERNRELGRYCGVRMIATHAASKAKALLASGWRARDKVTDERTRATAHGLSPATQRALRR